MRELLGEIVQYHPILTLVLTIGPWSLGVSLIIALIINAYRDWLWKGMDEERRYYEIKVAKW